MKKIACALGALALALPFSATAATTTTACSALDSTASYGSFGGCVGNGNNTFSNVNSIVSALFGDEGVTLDPALSFYQGAPDPVKAGAEFTGDRASVGFDATDGFTNGTAVEFLSLPDDTLFVTLKAATGFTLYSAADFLGMTFDSGVTNNQGKAQNISNIGTYGGKMPDIAPVPLPAAGGLLIGALGGLGLMRRRKNAA